MFKREKATSHGETITPFALLTMRLLWVSPATITMRIHATIALVEEVAVETNLARVDAKAVRVA